MKKGVLMIALFVFAAGCAGGPGREAVKIDMSLPVGKIDGNQFAGVRYPFKVSAPPQWKVSAEYPAFMLELGYEKPGLEESELFIFNPVTQSNFQIDFVAASPNIAFSQGLIESLTNRVVKGTTKDLQEEYGKDLQIEVGPTERILLKGIPFASKKYVTYAVQGVKYEQGWIYAYSEPYQIFILYIEKGGEEDRGNMMAVLNSFEYVPPRK